MTANDTSTLFDSKLMSKNRGSEIERKFLEKAKRKLTKAAVGARFYAIFDIMMEIVGLELGRAASREFLDTTLKMAVSVGYHVKVGDFSRETVSKMRRLTHDLAMTASHYQKMSMIYDGDYIKEIIASLCQLMHVDGSSVLDGTTHGRIDKVAGFFSMSIMDQMFQDDGKYKEPSLRLMDLLDSLIAEGRI